MSKCTQLQIGFDEMQVSWGCTGYLFIYLFKKACCSGWTSNQSCFPNSRLSGERMDKQITFHQEEAELGSCALFVSRVGLWFLVIIWGAKKPPKSLEIHPASSHALMDLIGCLDMRATLRRPPSCKLIWLLKWPLPLGSPPAVLI